MKNRKYTSEEIQNCIITLEALVEDSEQLDPVSAESPPKKQIGVLR